MTYETEAPSWRRITRTLLVLWLALLAGCATQLAPDYDARILQSLTEFNGAAQAQLASVADGTEAGLSPAEAAAYDALEGSGRALILLIQARPAPSAEIPSWLGAGDGGSDVDLSGIALLDVPTDDQIEEILKQFRLMRDDQRTEGLAPGQVEAYRGAIESFMRNALTYEMALER